MALFSYPVCTWLCQYVNMGVRKWLEKSAEKQKYKMRKTANPLSRKAFRAVSFSATKDTSEQSSLCSDVFFVSRSLLIQSAAGAMLACSGRFCLQLTRQGLASKRTADI